jgi:hypothetical protein
VLPSLRGQSNYAAKFTNFILQIAKITQSVLPSLSEQLNYPTQFTNSNRQTAKITQPLLPGLSGQITQPNLLSEITKLPKLPDLCHPV